MNQNKKLQTIFDNFNFLAKQPFEIGVSLGIFIFALMLGLIGLDIWNNTGSRFGIFLLILNLVIIVIVIVHIANMKETVNIYNNGTSGQFLYKKSLQLTRFIQRELVFQIGDSKFPTAKTQIQKYNNKIRLLSFVVVFENEA